LSLKALRYCIPRVEKVDRQQIESDAADSSERKLAMLPMSSGGKGISARSPGHEDLEATDRGPGGCWYPSVESIEFKKTVLWRKWQLSPHFWIEVVLTWRVCWRQQGDDRSKCRFRKGSA
jgi:hypothetical protein